MISSKLLSDFTNYFTRKYPHPFVVKPSIPIIYFGDEPAYRNSDVKIITVGKNPSDNEFLNPSSGRHEIHFRFPGYNGTNLERVMNDYFKQNPLNGWFNSFEPILNGMGGSFYPKVQYPNKALHTDICSPAATSPTWSKLTKTEKTSLFTEGVQLWWELVHDLAPDVMLVSVPERLFLDHLSQSLGKPFHSIINKANGLKRSSPYVVYKQITTINGKPTKIIFGRAANKPFDTITKTDKLTIGGKI